MIPPPTVLATLPATHLPDSARHFHPTFIQRLSLASDASLSDSQPQIRRKRKDQVVVGCPGGIIQIYDVCCFTVFWVRD